jgi:hypothetical protein
VRPEFTTHVSEFTTHVSEFTTHVSEFTTHVSEFSTHVSEFTTYVSEFTCRELLSAMTISANPAKFFCFTAVSKAAARAGET